MHLVQTFFFFPSIFFDCRLIYCLLMVLLFAWDLVASFFEPRPQMSHFFWSTTGIPFLGLIAFCGHKSQQKPQLVHLDFRNPSSFLWCCPSGLEHHRQCKGQPLKYTFVRIPGPSWIAKRSIFQIAASECFFTVTSLFRGVFLEFLLLKISPKSAYNAQKENAQVARARFRLL